MRSNNRRLALKREALTELRTEDLQTLAGAAAAVTVPTYRCTYSPCEIVIRIETVTHQGC